MCVCVLCNIFCTKYFLENAYDPSKIVLFNINSNGKTTAVLLKILLLFTLLYTYTYKTIQGVNENAITVH